MKLAQAVISRTVEGRWKIFVQSDESVQAMLVGDLEDIINELRAYGRREWAHRS